MKNLLFALFLFVAADIFAQDTLTIFIPADRLVSDVLTPKKMYKYDGFLPGKIFFRDGNFAEGKFNYNYLNGEIEFIEKDTLAIAKQQMFNIKMMTVDRDTFFYDKGYLQQVVGTPLGKLLKKQMLIVMKREKIGAYDQPTATSAIESYSSFSDAYGSFNPNLRVRENITLVLRTDYYFGSKFNVFLFANKKNLLKAYPNKKEQINQYFKRREVNFRNGEDLKKLLVSLSV
jgi:hypothetical protein